MVVSQHVREESCSTNGKTALEQAVDSKTKIFLTEVQISWSMLLPLSHCQRKYLEETHVSWKQNQSFSQIHNHLIIFAVRNSDKMTIMIRVALYCCSMFMCALFRRRIHRVFLCINHFNYGQVRFIKFPALINLMNMEEETTYEMDYNGKKMMGLVCNSVEPNVAVL